MFIGNRTVSKLDELKGISPDLQIGSVADAAAFGQVIVLCVAGSASIDALKGLEQHTAGKPVIDATNPIDTAQKPTAGVLPFFTGPNDSLGERLQKAYPRAHIVKAFNSVGSYLFCDPKLPSGGKPTMFYAGNDKEAKATVARIIDEFGWEPLDTGAIETSRALEPLCQLWCIPGIRDGNWAPHAFKMLH